MFHGKKALMNQPNNSKDERNFGEFRRKVKSAEVLSASMEHLLMSLHFTGKVTVLMQNGRVLKSGYEESYFRQGREGNTEGDQSQEL
jgi:hypothetical protein